RITDGAGVTLVLDATGRPVGWEGSGLERGSPAATGGSFTDADSLRLVIDLTLSSPVGIAVQVDGEGRATGLVHQHDLVDHLAERRSAAARRPSVARGA
ncbi:MAG: hypothetical protein ACRYF3_11270, partial [Janthinobacterium lividum]